jgi:hypothetical protein
VLVSVHLGMLLHARVQDAQVVHLDQSGMPPSCAPWCMRVPSFEVGDFRGLPYSKEDIHYDDCAWLSLTALSPVTYNPRVRVRFRWM